MNNSFISSTSRFVLSPPPPPILFTSNQHLEFEVEEVFDERVFRTLFRALSHARMGGKPLVSVLEVKHHYSFLATRMGVPAKAFFEELPVRQAVLRTLF